MNLLCELYFFKHNKAVNPVELRPFSSSTEKRTPGSFSGLW